MAQDPSSPATTTVTRAYYVESTVTHTPVPEPTGVQDPKARGPEVDYVVSPVTSTSEPTGGRGPWMNGPDIDYVKSPEGIVKIVEMVSETIIW